MNKKRYCPYCGGRLERIWWEGANRLFCQGCQQAVYENPVPAACLVVVDGQNRILLVKRSAPPEIGKWCLPGGFVELGETPETAALRELKEETALAGRIEMMLGMATTRSDQYNTILLISYLVKNYSGHPVAGDDASEVGYFHPADLPDIAFSSHRQFIRIYCAAHAENGCK